MSSKIYHSQHLLESNTLYICSNISVAPRQIFIFNTKYIALFSIFYLERLELVPTFFIMPVFRLEKVV